MAKSLPTLALISWLFLLLLNGCFFHRSMITVVPREAGGGEASDSEKSAAVAAVAEVATRFRLTPSANIERVHQLSEEGARSSYRVLAQYERARDPETEYSRVVVSVGINNQTRDLVVTVVDLDKGTETAFTVALEAALVEALRDRLPKCRIEVARTREGPSLFAP
jgi:hypothetical protein